MSVGDVIMKILEMFGPILVEALKKWLDSVLNKAAKQVYGAAYAEVRLRPDGLRGFSDNVIGRAIENTPRRQVIRRALLRHMQQSAPKAIEAGRLSPSDKREIQDLAGHDDE